MKAKRIIKKVGGEWECYYKFSNGRVLQFRTNDGWTWWETKKEITDMLRNAIFSLAIYGSDDQDDDCVFIEVHKKFLSHGIIDHHSLVGELVYKDGSIYRKSIAKKYLEELS
jgi:hypothetical protein